MRAGRTGIWVADNGAVCVGAVLEVVNHDTLRVRTTDSDGYTRETTVNRPDFHKIDASASDNAAKTIRQKLDVQLGGFYGVSYARQNAAEAVPQSVRVPSPVQALADAGITVGKDVVTLSTAVVEAIRQATRQIVNKKKVTGSYFTGKASKKASKK